MIGLGMVWAIWLWVMFGLCVKYKKFLCPWKKCIEKWKSEIDLAIEHGTSLNEGRMKTYRAASKAYGDVSFWNIFWGPFLLLRSEKGFGVPDWRSL